MPHRRLRPSFGWLALLLLVAIAPGARADRNLNHPGYTLTWHDEFDGAGLNSTKWNATTGFNNANNEWQYYSPTNVFVTGGALVLKSDRVVNGAQTNYVSGKVTSSGKFAQRYGWFEWSGQTPRGKGIWPAYWMLSYAGWPPEIDVMETIGTTPTCNTMSLHRGPLPPGCTAPWNCGMSYNSQYCGTDFTAAQHTFAVDWQPTGATWYVDGVQRASTSNLGNCTNAMYLIMNTAIGGDWPGPPDGTTPFPGTNRVDYVRVWTPLSGRYALLNAEFNAGEGVSDFDNWNSYDNGNVIRDASSSNARSGGRCVQVYGRYSGADNTSGLYQDLAAYPGEVWRASVWARNRPGDIPAGGNQGRLKVEFVNSSGAVLASAILTILTNTSPTTYAQFTVQATAPANTARARIVLEYFQTANGSGSVLFDDASLELLPHGYVHAGGTELLDAAGQPLLLRGVNFGSWLYPEAWMMDGLNLNAYAGADDFEKLNAAVLDVLDGNTNLAAAALGMIRSNFITAADIAFLKASGFNCARVPLHYQLFADPVTGQAREDGFACLDPLLAWCATNSFYLLPDLHGVPGGKDYARAGNVFTNTTARTLYLNVWQRVAARYATNAWIAGWDLLNEPVNTDGSARIPNNLLSTLYAMTRNAIRAVDTNHLLVCEGDWYASAIDRINTTGWSDANLCYSDHRYGDAQPFSAGRKSICVGANVPLINGEFGYNSTHWNNVAVTNLEQADLLTAGGRTATLRSSWCYWSYKSPQIYVLAQYTPTAGWGTLKSYWASPGSTPRPGAANAFNWIAEFARATHFSNCVIRTEVADSLTRANSSFTTQRLPFRAGLTIPGRIQATDYDLGAEGLAYHDTVSTDEAGSGPAGRAWNNGWNGRDDGVDIGICSDVGTPFKIGWNDAGEWQRYSVNCTPGTYHLRVRYGAPASGAQVRVLVNGADLAGAIVLPATGGYGTYANRLISNVPVAASGPATLEVRCNAAGYDWLWVELSVTNTIPVAPTGLTATSTNLAALLKWNASAGASSYTVKRSFVSGGPYTNIATGLTATSYIDAGRTNGSTAYYVVTAVNLAGESLPSNQAGSTVFVASPTLGFVPGYDGHSLTLSWPASAGAFLLTSATNLQPPVLWLPVTNSPSLSNGVRQVTLPLGAGGQFYRLALP